MDPATQSAAITALAAIAGSIVGGLASFLTTFFTQRNQAHRDLVSRDVAKREELYSQFIKEAANLYADTSDTREQPANFSEKNITDENYPLLRSRHRSLGMVTRDRHVPIYRHDIFVTQLTEEESCRV
jgi:hypothetical protein